MSSQPPQAAAHEDPKTVAYFDEKVHDYSVERLEFVAEHMRALARPGSSIIDLGCGTGNTLAYLKSVTGIDDLWGVDVSAKCLEAVSARVGCPTYRGSILDEDLPARIGRRFDFAVLAAVLHHLIGRTRRASKGLAESALRQALALLEPGGHLFVVEPIFYPPVAMDALFYVKKVLSTVTNDRIELFDQWNNIGAPVVSYLTNEELFRMIERAGAEIVAHQIRPLNWGRLEYFFNRTNTTVVARKPA